MHVPAQAEGAAFGAALQALWADGHAQGDQASLAEVVLQHQQDAAALSAQPDPQRGAQYQAHYQTFLKHLHAIGQLYAG